MSSGPGQACTTPFRHVPLVVVVTRTISTLFGAVVYVGLSALGWDGIQPLLAHPARIAAVAVLFALTLAGMAAKGGNLSPGVREDRSNRWVLAAFGILGLLGGWLPAFDDRRNIWTIDGDAVRWLGVVLFAAGGALRLWPVYVLGNRFSGLVAIQPGHTLVTTGVYGAIRHPSYLGLMVMSVGWALVFRSGLGVLAAALQVPPLLARINSEEKLLGEEFDGEYEAWRKRTSRMIPGIY